MANNVEFKVIVTYEDGQAKVKIEGLTDAINKNSAASKQAASSTRDLGNAQKELNEPLEGSIGALERQNVELLKKIKNQSNDIVESKRLIQVYRANSIEIQRMTKAIGLNNQANIGMISNSGLAGATLTEFGRTISDLPYGIQGVANNLSQLSTLFITFTEKTGGLGKSLKQLGKELIGPLGIVLALQAAIAAWDFLAKKQREAGDSVERVRDQYIANQGVLLGQVELLKDLNTSEEDRLDIINKLKEDIPSLQDADFDYGQNLEKVTQKIIDYTLAQANRAEAENLIEENKELLAKRREISTIREIKDQSERLAAYEDFSKRYDESVSRYNEVTKTATGLQGQFTQLVAKTPEELLESYEFLGSKLTEESNDVYNQIQDLLKDSASLSSKALQESEKDLLEFLDKIYDDIEVQGTGQFEKRRIQAKQEYDARKEEIEAVLAKESDLTKEEKERLSKALLDIQKSYNKELDLIKEDEIQFQKYLDEKELSDKEKQLAETAKEVLKQNKHLADKERSDRRLAAANTIKDKEKLQEELDKIDEDYIKRQQDYIQTMIDSGLISTQVGIRMIEALDSKLSDIAVRRAKRSGKKEEDPLSLEEVLDVAKKAIDELENLFNAQFDADISREEAKTEKLNNELRKRLNNEKLTAEQREAINNQIAANEAALQQRRDEIAEKNFKLQKAISISRTLISTYEMAANAYKALAGIPVVGPALGTAAAAAASIFGLNQVKAISETEFVPSAIATPNISAATSPAPTIQAPNFNVVGASNQNQLAEAINAKLDKPIEAFVVSKNIKTALELDRNKVQSAGL